jgi:hypothetical protein
MTTKAANQLNSRVAVWVGHIDRQIGKLEQSALCLAIDDQSKSMSMLHVRWTGIAPGNLHAGFAI